MVAETRIQTTTTSEEETRKKQKVMTVCSTNRKIFLVHGSVLYREECSAGQNLTMRYVFVYIL